MKANELINLKSEILEPLHVVATELAELDAKNKGHVIEYTDLDVKAVAVTFFHITANRKSYQYIKAKQPIDLMQIHKEMTEYGRRVAELVKEMTGIDINEKEKNE